MKSEREPEQCDQLLREILLILLTFQLSCYYLHLSRQIGGLVSPAVKILIKALVNS